MRRPSPCTRAHSKVRFGAVRTLFRFSPTPDPNRCAGSTAVDVTSWGRHIVCGWVYGPVRGVAEPRKRFGFLAVGFGWCRDHTDEDVAIGFGRCKDLKT